MFCRLLNIGNTHILTAVLQEDGSITDYRVFDTPGFQPEDLPEGDYAVVSVVPEWEDYYRKKGAFILNWESAEKVLSLSQMGTPWTVGADRIANGVALQSTGKVPALCIDCGTAVTFEYVDSSGNLRGGAILPGRQLLRKSLHDYTAKLPLVSFPEQVPGVPGKNTVEAIQIGVDLGAVGAVREILMEFLKKEPDLRVVFCGGDSCYFHSCFPNTECFGSDFTLKGLAFAWTNCR